MYHDEERWLLPWKQLPRTLSIENSSLLMLVNNASGHNASHNSVEGKAIATCTSFISQSPTQLLARAGSPDMARDQLTNAENCMEEAEAEL